MFDFYLGAAEQIPFSVHAQIGDYPFKRVNPTKYDVFLIESEYLFAQNEIQGMQNYLTHLPAGYSIKKVLHFNSRTVVKSALLDETHEPDSKMIHSSLFLVVPKKDCRPVVAAITELGFNVRLVKPAILNEICPLSAFDKESLIDHD